MKKILALLLALVMVFAMAACGGGDSDTGSGGDAAKNESYTVYLITMDQIDAHWQKVNTGCKKAVDELAKDGITVNYTWLAPEVKSNSDQIEQIGMAVSAQADVILLAANDATACNDAIQSALDSGVKVIYVDSPAELAASATFSTDNEAAGKQAGEILLKALKDDGVTSGNIGIVGVLASTDSCVKRENGFRSVFEGTDFTLGETQYMEGDTTKSQEAAANMINNGCIALYGVNEGSSIGVGNAVMDASSKVYAVGFDASSSVCDQISNGHLIAAMAQNPNTMGYEGIKAAVKVAQGTDLGGKVTDTGVTAVTKDNVADFK